jgi:hypothetical protein
MGALGGLLDLKPASRGLFVLLFLVVQVAGIGWGQRAPDHVLGFQMFNESSRIHVELFREVERKRGRVLLAVPDGRWQARDAAGKLRDHAWQDRVKSSRLSTFGVWMHANYGLDAQLFRLQAALDDVAAHIPEDKQTRALVLVIEAMHNGRPARTIQLRAERP